MLNLGYFGFGNSTINFHLPYTLRHPNFRVHSICSRKREDGREQKYKEYNINFTTNPTDIISNPDIDIIVINTPHGTHLEIGKKALAAGKHIIVEKPIVNTKDEILELLDYAEKMGKICVPYHNRRYDADFLAAKIAVESGKLGDIIEVISNFDFHNPNPGKTSPDYYNSSIYGLGVHSIDQIVGLLGIPHKVYCDIRNRRDFIETSVDGVFALEMFYKNGTKATVRSTNWANMELPRFVIQGTLGSFIKYGVDIQRQQVKFENMMPWDKGFGIESENNYGKMQYLENGQTIPETIIEIIPTPLGDYAQLYDNVYEHIKNNKGLFITKNEIISVVEILERGINNPSPHVFELQ